MTDHYNRIRHYKGTPYEIGFASGRALGDKLEQTISIYINTIKDSRDMQKLKFGAMPWLRGLPKRYQDEFEGMAAGSGVPLERIAEWSYVEECEQKGCSGAVCIINDQAWVLRNNDLYVPELWGYVTIRETNDRIPTISFGMEGDIFAPTGINKEKLWLHYNYLSVWDQPSQKKPHMPAYVFITNALEQCRTIDDVEALLNEIDRDDGMLLFAVDGKTNEFALFDCLCSKHYRREPENGRLIGTNHFCACEDQTLGDDAGSIGTLKRYQRMEQLIQEFYASATPPNLPANLIRILADDDIERRAEDTVTVYSNVACPHTGDSWYTFGGYPSASKGNWQRLDWPWSDQVTE